MKEPDGTADASTLPRPIGFALWGLWDDDGGRWVAVVWDEDRDRRMACVFATAEDAIGYASTLGMAWGYPSLVVARMVAAPDSPANYPMYRVTAEGMTEVRS